MTGQMPIGDSGRDYDELCILIRAYGKRLSEGGSYADMLRIIERITKLRDKAKELWGDRQ